MVLNEADAYDALRSMVEGHKSHELAQVLIDELGYTASLDSVAAHIRKGLNPRESECLKNIETIVLERYTGRHAWLKFHCQAVGRGFPERMDVDELYLQTVARAEDLERRAKEAREKAAALLAHCREQGKPIFVPGPDARFHVAG